MKSIFAAVDIGSELNTPFGQTKSVGDLISIILNGGLVIAGVIIVFLIVMGGLQMIAGAGNNDPKASAAGHQAITWAVIGFIVVFSTFLIIRLIEIITGNNFITAPNIVNGVCPPVQLPGSPPCINPN
jgi:hypothetical protein